MKLKNYMRNGKRFEISLGIIKRRSENVNAFTKGEEELEELRGQLQAVDESVDSCKKYFCFLVRTRKVRRTA